MKKEKTDPKIRLEMRVSLDEREIIKNKAQHSGYKSMNMFLRKMALNGISIRVSLENLSDISRITYLISTATNNINQVARHVNETATVYSSDIKNLKNQVTEMQSQIIALDMLIKERLDEQASKIEKLLKHIGM